MFLLDAGAINSFVLHKLKYKEQYEKDRTRQRRQMLELLSQELMLPGIQERDKKDLKIIIRTFNHLF